MVLDDRKVILSPEIRRVIRNDWAKEEEYAQMQIEKQKLAGRLMRATTIQPEPDAAMPLPHTEELQVALAIENLKEVPSDRPDLDNLSKCELINYGVP